MNQFFLLETCCADADGSQQQVQLAFETLAKRAYISAFPDDTGAAALYEAEVLRQVLRDGAGAEQLQSSEPVMAQQQRQPERFNVIVAPCQLD